MIDILPVKKQRKLSIRPSSEKNKKNEIYGIIGYVYRKIYKIISLPEEIILYIPYISLLKEDGEIRGVVEHMDCRSSYLEKVFLHRT